MKQGEDASWKTGSFLANSINQTYNNQSSCCRLKPAFSLPFNLNLIIFPATVGNRWYKACPCLRESCFPWSPLIQQQNVFFQSLRLKMWWCHIVTTLTFYKCHSCVESPIITVATLAKLTDSMHGYCRADLLPSDHILAPARATSRLYFKQGM